MTKTAVILNNIFFTNASSDLIRVSEDELYRVRKVMLENPKIEVEIGVHTDNMGGKIYNDNLSSGRAVTVKKWLLSNGVPDSRLVAKGYGYSGSVATNSTEEGRAKNRRTEFKVL